MGRYHFAIRESMPVRVVMHLRSIWMFPEGPLSARPHRSLAPGMKSLRFLKHIIRTEACSLESRCTGFVLGAHRDNIRRTVNIMNPRPAVNLPNEVGMVAVNNEIIDEIADCLSGRQHYFEGWFTKAGHYECDRGRRC